MSRAAATIWAVVLATGLVAGRVHAGEEVCVGDCNGDDVVTVSDLVLGVNIVLGNTPASACPAFQNEQGNVNVAQLIKGVNNLLNGCFQPTATVTQTGGVPTATATPTPTTGTVKTRVFNIQPGTLLAAQNDSPTGLFTTGLSGANASTMFPPGPLTLTLGAQDANGVAQLRLKEDVTLDIGIVDGSRFCLKLEAATSRGSIDCNGGTPYDISASRPSNAPGIDFTYETNLGPPAGAGDGDFIVTTMLQIVPSTDPTTPCDQIVYTNPPQDFAYTTTTGTSTVDDTVLILVDEGRPFDCANFETQGSGGRLTAPLPANQAPIGNVANAMRFAEIGEAP